MSCSAVTGVWCAGYVMHDTSMIPGLRATPGSLSPKYFLLSPEEGTAGNVCLTSSPLHMNDNKWPWVTTLMRIKNDVQNNWYFGKARNLTCEMWNNIILFPLCNGWINFLTGRNMTPWKSVQITATSNVGCGELFYHCCSLEKQL